MAKKVITVCGEVTPDKLGFTDMHEHIMFDGSTLGRRFMKQYPKQMFVEPDDKVTLENVGIIQHNAVVNWDGLNLFDEEAMTGEVEDFKLSGGNTLLELSVPGLRWDVPAIKRISEKTGVNVVTATGFYTEDSWQGQFDGWTLKMFYDRMIDEVKNGIDGSGIFPGHVKIAISSLSPAEENTLRAGGRVAAETGMSITVHPGSKAGGDARRIIKILKEEGVSGDRIVIAHVPMIKSRPMRDYILYPDTTWGLNLDYAKAILAEGATISSEFGGSLLDFEALGSVSTADWQKLAGLVRLIDEGYCEQMVLGTDMCAKINARRFGGMGYCRLTNFAIPALKNLGGVSDFAINCITIKNPARILAF